MEAEPYRYSLVSRALLLCTGFVTALTVLSARLFEIQYLRHDEYLGRVAETSPTREPSVPLRGDLLDRRGKILATSRPVSDLLIDRYKVPSDRMIKKIAVRETGLDEEAFTGFGPEDYQDLYWRLLAKRLCRPLLREEPELYRELSGDKMDFALAKDLPAQDAHQLVNELFQEGYRGLRLSEKIERIYTGKQLACHVIGYVYHPKPEADPLLRGAEGVERTLDGILAGEPGFREYAEDGALVAESPAVNGDHVMLTIDVTFQAMVERILERHWRELSPERMTAIFADPGTGEILALVNLPNYAPSEGGNVNPELRWNTAVASNYEPGSPFKLVAHGAALNEGLVNLDTVVRCYGGSYWEPGFSKRLRDIGSGYETATVRQVIGKSLNTGTFSVSQQLDPAVYHRYIKLFGFGGVTGLRISGESPGMVPPPSKWAHSRFFLSRLGMGYNLSATPLQMLNLMSIICNQGELVRFRIVKQILDAETMERTIADAPEVLRNVISPRTAYRLREALIYAAQEGTGKRALIDGYVIGGKTGTAEKHFPGKGYLPNRNVASFLGFIGREEGAALVGIVVVDDPQNEGKRYGGTIAAPIFREIAQAGMHHLGIVPNELASSQGATAGKTARNGRQ